MLIHEAQLAFPIPVLWTRLDPIKRLHWHNQTHLRPNRPTSTGLIIQYNKPLLHAAIRSRSTQYPRNRRPVPQVRRITRQVNMRMHVDEEVPGDAGGHGGGGRQIDPWWSCRWGAMRSEFRSSHPGSSGSGTPSRRASYAYFRFPLIVVSFRA